MIRTALVCLFLGLCLVLFLPWLILYTILCGSADPMYRAAIVVVRFAVRRAGVRLHVEGRENIPPGVCVFAANHASNVDPPVLVSAIPRRVALLAKKEVFRIPFLSRAMRLAKFVPVDRADREAAAASVEIALQYMREGISFAVFPEGTRSPDGRLRPFKKGTFLMAIRAGVPVVPVSLVGTHRLMRKGERFIHPGEVTVRFGPPVDASRYTLDERGELLSRVEARVAAGLPEDQQPLPSAASS